MSKVWLSHPLLRPLIRLRWNQLEKSSQIKDPTWVAIPGNNVNVEATEINNRTALSSSNILQIPHVIKKNFKPHFKNKNKQMKLILIILLILISIFLLNPIYT